MSSLSCTSRAPDGDISQYSYLLLLLFGSPRWLLSRCTSSASKHTREVSSKASAQPPALGSCLLGWFHRGLPGWFRRSIAVGTECRKAPPPSDKMKRRSVCLLWLQFFTVYVPVAARPIFVFCRREDGPVMTLFALVCGLIYRFNCRQWLGRGCVFSWLWSGQPEGSFWFPGLTNQPH